MYQIKSNKFKRYYFNLKNEDGVNVICEDDKEIIRLCIFSLYRNATVYLATKYPHGGFRCESFDANAHFRKQSVLN